MHLREKESWNEGLRFNKEGKVKEMWINFSKFDGIKIAKCLTCKIKNIEKAKT